MHICYLPSIYWKMVARLEGLRLKYKYKHEWKVWWQYSLGMGSSDLALETQGIYHDFFYEIPVSHVNIYVSIRKLFGTLRLEQNGWLLYRQSSFWMLIGVSLKYILMVNNMSILLPVLSGYCSDQSSQNDGCHMPLLGLNELKWWHAYLFKNSIIDVKWMMTKCTKFHHQKWSFNVLHQCPHQSSIPPRWFILNSNLAAINIYINGLSHFWLWETDGPMGYSTDSNRTQWPSVNQS